MNIHEKFDGQLKILSLSFCYRIDNLIYLISNILLYTSKLILLKYYFENVKNPVIHLTWISIVLGQSTYV